MAILGDKHIKELVGQVTSAKMDKTRVVTVPTVKIHPLYKKRYTVRKKYYAHDENNASQEGDRVTIREMRPLSKLKRWNIEAIVEKTGA